MKIPCYLGIDVGTQGLTALLVESVGSNSSIPSTTSKAKTSLKVLAIGEGNYGFVPDLPDGCYEQNPADWETALVRALKEIQEEARAIFSISHRIEIDLDINAICVTGQMHGCVMIDRDGKSIGTARLWCDARNQEEVCTVGRMHSEEHSMQSDANKRISFSTVML